MTLADEKLYNFKAALKKHKLDVRPLSLETLWVNITRLCNQSCLHCHVDASPNRKEVMNRTIIDRCLEIMAENNDIKNLDITGGEPELHPDFDYLIIQTRRLNKHIIVRHNLTVISDGNTRTGESKAYLPEFFAENGVEILASLPYYDREFTDGIRGPGVFEKSIRSLRLLNEQGYGKPGEGLLLNLVYNHDGPLCPEDRARLETAFKQELMSHYRLSFNSLFTVTNTPINRFHHHLQQSGTYHEYMRQLIGAFSPEAAEGVACRSLISVGYDGRIYDCDFNQMLDMQITKSKPLTVFDFDRQALLSREILFASHCFGCTAGGGSS